MSALTEPTGRAGDTAGHPVAATVLEVVIPVFNEEAQLAASVERVLAHLATLPWSYRVTVADNASTDQTALIARRLAHTHAAVEVVHLAEKGRGRALKRVWSASESDVLVYMDVDLSTDLAALLPLVAPLVSGHSDLAIGSRLARSSRVERGAKREIVSRGYNLILRRALRARFSDAQCGFKAIRREAARELLPLVVDDRWFFDTELLVVAERSGLRIHEVPVDWVDDPDSSVDIVRTALDDLRGVARLGTALVRGTLPLREVGERLGRTSAEAGTGRLGLQVGVFLLIGIGSTLAYALLFLALRHSTSPWWANFTALLVTAVLNTAANRRFTFGVRGPEGALRHQVQGLLVFAAGLGATTGSLALLHASGRPGAALEVTVLTVANLAVTVLRFVAMRWWVFARRPTAVAAGDADDEHPGSAAVSARTAASPAGPAARRRGSPGRPCG
ncbi:MAG: sugar translocase [Marmoricola sp.]|nr:sugar translocase [Marmoricola sp.]